MALQPTPKWTSPAAYPVQAGVNAELVALLESLLAEAKRGECRCAVIVAERGGRVYHSMSGTAPVGDLIGALETAKFAVMRP